MASPNTVRALQCPFLFTNEVNEQKPYVNEMEYLAMPHKVVRGFVTAGLRAEDLRKVVHVATISLQIAFEELQWYKSYPKSFKDTSFISDHYSKNFWSRIERLNLHGSPSFAHTIERIYSSSSTAISQMILRADKSRIIEKTEKLFWEEIRKELNFINYGARTL